MAGYIGVTPVPQATQHRESFTATSGQTSFATAGYTPQFLDVYLNGVHLLDGTDYTATNGSDVVLTTGAASGDTLEVVAYTAFEAANVTGATDFTVTGSFTSRGIDDNATSTAMTLDASGNLLVGTTDAAVGVGNTNTGLSLANSGYAAFSRTGSPTQSTLFLNKNSNDGSIVNFAKDGSTVGSISSVNGNSLGISSSGGVRLFDSDSGGLIASSGKIFPANSSGATSDNSIDIGAASTRFKDLYLSGGVYLGGTGSANKLEDYEEGTWTPTYPSGWTAESQYANYTKVGRFCYYNAKILVNSTGSGGFVVGGLPFTNGIYAKTHGGQMFEQVTLSTSRTQVVGFTPANSNTHEIYQLHNTGGAWIGLTSSNLNTNSEFYIQGVLVKS